MNVMIEKSWLRCSCNTFVFTCSMGYFVVDMTDVPLVRIHARFPIGISQSIDFELFIRFRQQSPHNFGRSMSHCGSAGFGQTCSHFIYQFDVRWLIALFRICTEFRRKLPGQPFCCLHSFTSSIELQWAWAHLNKVRMHKFCTFLVSFVATAQPLVCMWWFTLFRCFQWATAVSFYQHVETCWFLIPHWIWYHGMSWVLFYLSVHRASSVR